MNEGHLIILGICAIGMSWRAYKIGIREGIDRYIEHCKKLSKKHNGRVLIHFHGKNIHFLDPLTYDKLVLDALTKDLEDDDSA